MNTSSTSSNNNKWLLYLILGAVGLWFLWQLLKLVYYTLSYVGFNSFLTLDLSVYGRLTAAHWLGYMLLGLLVGAAGGALAAQRRYGLNKRIRFGGWATMLLALGILYTGIVLAPVAESQPLIPTVIEPTQVATDTMEVSSASPSDAEVTTAPVVTTEKAAVIDDVPLSEEITSDQVDSDVAKEATKPLHPTKSTDSEGIETESKVPILVIPSGRQQHTGQINNLAVTYLLDWQSNGVLSGSYYYDQHPNTIYRLTGSCTANGKLHLLEFTRGRQTAQCALQLTKDGFAGTMDNIDGRQFTISLTVEGINQGHSADSLNSTVRNH